MLVDITLIDNLRKKIKEELKDNHDILFPKDVSQIISQYLTYESKIEYLLYDKALITKNNVKLIIKDFFGREEDTITRLIYPNSLDKTEYENIRCNIERPVGQLNFLFEHCDTKTIQSKNFLYHQLLEDEKQTQEPCFIPQVDEGFDLDNLVVRDAFENQDEKNLEEPIFPPHENFNFMEQVLPDEKTEIKEPIAFNFSDSAFSNYEQNAGSEAKEPMLFNFSGSAFSNCEQKVENEYLVNSFFLTVVYGISYIRYKTRIIEYCIDFYIKYKELHSSIPSDMAKILFNEIPINKSSFYRTNVINFICNNSIFIHDSKVLKKCVQEFGEFYSRSERNFSTCKINELIGFLKVYYI